MRQQHLRVLLEDRGDDQGRDVLRDRVERLQRVGAHVEFDPAGDQLQAVVHVRPARQDGDVEAVLPVGAVGHRLVEAAVLGLRHPVGGESDLVELLRLRGAIASQPAARIVSRSLASISACHVLSNPPGHLILSTACGAKSTLRNRFEPFAACLRPRGIRRLIPIIRRALTIGVRSPLPRAVRSARPVSSPTGRASPFFVDTPGPTIEQWRRRQCAPRVFGELS